jgi:U3 small nucleolar RNA-associated protein 14
VKLSPRVEVNQSQNLGLGVLEQIHSSDSEPEEEKADPIAKALNPGAAKKKVGIQLVDEDAAPPHGVKRRASEDPSSSESESESSSEESSSESEDEDAASGEDDPTAKRHGS